MSSTSETKYSPLRSSDEELQRTTWHYHGSTPYAQRLLHIALISVSLVLGGILGFTAGRLPPNSPFGNLLQPIGSDVQVWHLNKSFSGAPSPQTEAAWESLIPLGRGFVLHEALDGRTGNIAVFHQLHCVHEVRVGYYAALARLNSPDTDTDSAAAEGSHDSHDGDIDAYLADLSKKDNPDHISHCFDYLRRVLMCASDTNMEYEDADGLFTGWGFERTCRNFDSVYDWAERHRKNNRTSIQ